MDTLNAILLKVQEAAWGIPTLTLLLGTGLFFTIKLKGIQFVRFPKALKLIFEKEEGANGDVSPFASLCTSLAASIGTGSIVGVATALRSGGPGALFWMWISALLGMAVKYSESLLAVKYRVKDEKGEYSGGPMYYIERGLGKGWKFLAVMFAVFGLLTALLGCGTFPQVNSITESITSIVSIPVWVIGIAVTVICGAVIIGGIRSISRVAEFVVPVMAVLYVGGALAVIFINYRNIPAVFGTIFHDAFSPSSVVGGFAGTTVMYAVMSTIRYGVARGIYTNEAGLGSSPIVSASAKTNSCVRQGLISMTSVFFTTIVVCTMTGFVIISSGLLGTSEYSGSVLASSAFGQGLPGSFGKYIVALGIAFFSFTTIIGWCYYGERCFVYLTNGTKYVIIYKLVYLAMIAVAPYFALDTIWTLADIVNAFMCFPNLIALLLLRNDVVRETKEFFLTLKRNIKDEKAKEKTDE